MEQSDHDVLMRIDERLGTLVDVFENHLANNREDFRDVHSRINVIAGKQNWMLGIGTVCGAGIGVVVVWVRNIFTGGS